MAQVIPHQRRRASHLRSEPGKLRIFVLEPGNGHTTRSDLVTLVLLLILMVMPARNRSKKRLGDEAAQKSGSWTKAAQGMDCIPAVRSPLAPKGRRKNNAAEIRIFVRHHSFCTPAFVDSNLRRCAECACCCGPQLTSTCARAFGDHASRHFQS